MKLRHKVGAALASIALIGGATAITAPAANAGNGNSVVCVQNSGPSSLQKPVIIQTVGGAYLYLYKGQCYTGVYAVYSEAPSPGVRCANAVAPNTYGYWGANKWVVLWNNSTYYCTYSYA